MVRSGQGGDHNIRAGARYEYATISFDTQDNYNGTFTFRSNGPFNAADPRTYPVRFQIRVPGPLAYTQKEHFVGSLRRTSGRPATDLP